MLKIAGNSGTYTPTWTNVTLGSSTNVGEYRRIGRWVEFEAALTIGAGGSVTGAVTVTLPFTAAVAFNPAQLTCWYYDTGTNQYFGFSDGPTTTTSGNLVVCNASGTYSDASYVSGTVPFSFGTGDQIVVEGKYWAAA